MNSKLVSRPPPLVGNDPSSLQADGGVRSERGPGSGARGAAGPYGGRAARKF